MPTLKPAANPVYLRCDSDLLGSTQTVFFPTDNVDALKQYVNEMLDEMAVAGGGTLTFSTDASQKAAYYAGLTTSTPNVNNIGTTTKAPNVLGWKGTTKRS